MRKIQSFVKRSGRLTESQNNALLNLSTDFIVSDIDNIWQNNHPIILEIGFGNGDSLLIMAKNEPENNFIGIEVYQAGVGRLINNAYNENLQNLKIIQDDAMDILVKMSNNFLSGLQLYFPDPWYKKKHNKRRIVNSNFLDIVAKKIQKNGFIHMATDWEGYAKQMLTELTKHKNFINTQNNFANKPKRRPTTKFERRGLKLGYKVWDLIFIKNE